MLIAQDELAETCIELLSQGQKLIISIIVSNSRFLNEFVRLWLLLN